MDVPQQTNDKDCALYTIANIIYITEEYITAYGRDTKPASLLSAAGLCMPNMLTADATRLRETVLYTFAKNAEILAGDQALPSNQQAIHVNVQLC
jgi:Ulp1 family protease